MLFLPNRKAGRNPCHVFAAAPPGASKMAQIEDMISEFQIRKQYPPARPKCAAVLEAQRRAVSAPGQGDSFIPKSVSRES